MKDRGDHFDGVRLSRPAVRALIDAGYERLSDLPQDLTSLLALHGLGPTSIVRIEKALRDR